MQLINYYEWRKSAAKSRLCSIMNKFCEYIKLKRADVNLTQEDLADYMGVSLISVQNWESGRTKIKEDRIAKLAEALRADEKELLDKLNDADEDFSNWPAFLFTDEQNEIISSIRLTPEHKKLLMLIRIYNADNFNRISQRELHWSDNIMKSLRRIPYKYTEEVGVYKLYEMGMHIENFLKYVPGDFCINLIREKPDSEFDLRKLEKKNIVKWLDKLIFFSSNDRWNLTTKFKDGLYSHLVVIISKFKESSRKFENYRQYRVYCNTERPINYGYGRYEEIIKEYIVKVYDEETLTLTTMLTEKGKQFYEWCKDIEL